MPMSSMAQGATIHQGENIFFEKQSTIKNFIGKSTAPDQIKSGICMALVLTWLASDNPERKVISSVGGMIRTSAMQDVLVHSWSFTYQSVENAALKYLAGCALWFTDLQEWPLYDDKIITADIFNNAYAMGKDVRFILCIQTSSHDNAHALGVWKTSNDQNFYVYDPNHGAVRIPRTEIYTFLADLIRSFYTDFTEYYVSAFVK